MNSECMIKSLLLFSVIFLIIKCLFNKETFVNIDLTSEKISEKIKKFKPVEVEIDNDYVFVTLRQLEKDKQKLVIDKLLNDSKFMDVKESKEEVEKGFFYKTPIFLVPKKEVISNNKLNFILISVSGAYALSPKSDKILDQEYLFYNEQLGLLYSARGGSNDDIVRINQDGFTNLFGLNTNWKDTKLLSIEKIKNKNLKLNIKVN
jgi:hypothetical protein